MGDLLGLTLEELVAGLRERGTRMPFEIGAFVALQVCEQLLVGPAVARPADVRIAEDGSVSLYVPPNSATGADAARSVAEVLAHLLVAAGQGVPPMLLDLVEQGPADGRRDLARLRDELEASLVPLNRAAASRVLSRLVREAQRRGDRPVSAGGAPEPDGDLDAQVDALLGSSGDEPTQEDAPPPAEGEPSPSAAVPTPRPPGLPSRPSRPMAEPAATSAPPDSVPPSEPPPAPWAEPASSEAVEAVASPPEPRAPRIVPDLDRFEDAPAGPARLGWFFAIGLLTLLGALVAAVAIVRPDVIDRMLGRPLPEDPAGEISAQARQQVERQLLEEHGRKFGTLIVGASPDRAQVLLFVGRGPAEIEDLPVGVAHEFVAIADGKRPTRAVVPKDAQWTEGEGEDGPRYELAMQAGEEPMNFEDLEVGETRLPQDVGTPGGTLGTVRIVTNPPGAKVYQLIGFGAHVEVDNLRTDRGHELLIVHDGHRPVRQIVGPSDWREGPDGLALMVEAALQQE